MAASRVVEADAIETDEVGAGGVVPAPPLVEQAATRNAADIDSNRDRRAVIRSLLYSRGVS